MTVKKGSKWAEGSYGDNVNPPASKIVPIEAKPLIRDAKTEKDVSINDVIGETSDAEDDKLVDEILKDV